MPIEKNAAQVIALVTLPRRIASGIERLARGQKSGRKQRPKHRRGGDEADDLPGQPAKLRAAPIERQQQRHRGADHQRNARDIEFMRAVVPRQPAQRPAGHHQRDGAERQIDPEDERPMQMIGQKPAEHRTENTGAHEHHRRVALRHRPLARAQEIGNDGLRYRNEPAAAHALEAAADDQHPHCRRQRTDERADDEDADRQQHDGAAAVDVGELAE